MKMSTQFTLKDLLMLVLAAALATAWLQKRHLRCAQQVRVARLEFDISVLAMIINKYKLTIAASLQYGEHSSPTRSPNLKDDYTKDALTHPPY